MIVRSFEDDSSGFDPRNYTPIGYSDWYPGYANSSTAEVTAFSVSGEGFIDLCSFYGNSTSPTSGFTFKFVVDGTTYTFQRSATSGVLIGGFSTGEYITQIAPVSGSHGTNQVINSRLSTALQAVVPFDASVTDYTADVATPLGSGFKQFAIGSVPIFFSSSFSAKYIRAVSGTAITHGIQISGGLLT